MLIRDHYNSGVICILHIGRKCTKNEHEKYFTFTLQPNKDSATKVHPDASFGTSLRVNMI